MQPRILLTGFKPFAGMDMNPTERLMKEFAQTSTFLPGITIRAVVLDTDYQLCEQQFSQVVQNFQPDIVLSFGVSYRADEITLERVARNLDHSAVPDTAGNLRQQHKIVENGPETYTPTIPVEKLHMALQAARIPVCFSDDAGSYVCNHLFYYGLHFLQQVAPQTMMGFIHVPPLPEQLKTADRTGMELMTLFKAVQVCMTAVLSYQ